MLRDSIQSVNVAMVAILLAANSAGATPQQAVCQKNTIVGTYKLVALQEIPPGKESVNFSRLSYQYLAFSNDNTYRFINAMQEFPTPAALNTAMEWVKKSGHILRYTLNDQGELNLYTDNVIDYRYRCFTISAPSDNYQKNDLALAATTRANSQLYKTYRRWY